MGLHRRHTVGAGAKLPLHAFPSPPDKRGGPGFVAVGRLEGEATVWTSADGLTWTREGGDEIFGGTASIGALTGAGDGVLAVGSFAPYPQPSCQTNAPYTSVQTFVPAVFRWAGVHSPGASAALRFGLDPRNLRLRHADAPSITDAWGSSGAYIDLCKLVPALGRHRAYMFGLSTSFGIGWLRGLAIVNRNAATATRVFRTHASSLLTPLIDSSIDAGSGAGIAPQYSEHHTRDRIGAAARIFQVTLQEEYCGPIYRTLRQGIRGTERQKRQGPHNGGNPGSCDLYGYVAHAVIWREGRVIGEVFEAGHGHNPQPAILHAKKQWRHLHPSAP